MKNTSLRIHPAIGMARVGNSTDYYLGPETMAASKQEGTSITGGLPIKKGTESTTITSEDIRDVDGRLKRQAARFKIYQYPTEGDTISYPTPGGTEVLIGSMVDDKKVVDIIWTAHLANKKANAWDDSGKPGYINDQTPPMRNPKFGNSASSPSDPERLTKLVIDAGPRTIKASNGIKAVKFDNGTGASYYDTNSKSIVEQPNYPIQFPATNGSSSNGSDPIEYLGEIVTESNGRLLVLGGHGLACAFDNNGNFDADQPLCNSVDNNNWLDDTSDGPVNAVLVFEGGEQLEVPGSAWAVVTDPAYAPQTLNAVTLWDDVYNTWLENKGLQLQPEIFDGTNYNKDYKPYFKDDVFPTLNSAHMQMWNTNLPDQAISAHKRVMMLTEEKPSFDIMSFIRNPDGSQDEIGAPLMPLSLGDIGTGDKERSLLSVSKQQYFFMQQWSEGKSVGAIQQPLGAGEQLDKTILVNCLGGRFSPGIDLTWIVRDTQLYNQDWTNPNVGPFRINKESLDYATAIKEKPFLGEGYIPLRTDTPIQPGDLCKFMSIPWHTDYNSCVTHTPSPNPGGKITNENVYSGDVNTTLFWSWPAQRPVAVYTFDDLSANNGVLPKQRFSVRGKGSEATDPPTNENLGCEPSNPPEFDTAAMNVGRYQNIRNMLTEWPKIGTIIQGPAIKGYPDNFDKDYYLEVESKFTKDESNLVVFWPNVVDDEVYPPND